MSTASPRSSQPRAASASVGPLASCSTFGRDGSASHAGEGGVVLGRDLGGVDPRAGAGARGQCDGDDLPGARTPRSLYGDADPLPVAGVLGEPARDGAGGQPLPVELEPGLVDLLGGGRVDGVHQPGAQLAADLQLVEQLEGGGAVPRLADGLARPHGQRQVADQRVEVAVADHVAEVGAQRLALLARDLVGAGDHVVEPVELVDPLGGVPLADSGDAGQVVGGLPHDGRELGIAPRRHAVLVLDVGRGEAGQVADPAHRVEHRRGLGDELDGVAVTGEDQHLHALGDGLGGEGGDDVVGLVALELEVPDRQRVEHLPDQRQLAAELARGLVPLGLVLRVFLEPEGLARLVERDARRAWAPRRGAR